LKALVTGSTGFIGSHLCRRLLTAGFEVRAFHRPDSPLILIDDLPVEHATGDITQPEKILDAMQEVDYVFHTAARLGRPVVFEELYRVNVLGTRYLIEAAIRSNVKRVIHTSTTAALGVPRRIPNSKDNHQLMNENNTWNFPARWWPYGHSKYRAELEVQSAVARGLDAVIVNPPLVIGAGDINRIGGETIIHAAKNHLFAAPPGGLNVIHIDDLVEGHLKALEFGGRGERYILGGENMTHLAYLILLSQVVGVRAPLFTVPDWCLKAIAPLIEIMARLFPLPIGGDLPRKTGFFFYYSTAKAKEDIQFLNQRSTQKALQEAYNWYCDHQIILGEKMQP
jgi:dihydroflavonol-4-reductase